MPETTLEPVMRRFVLCALLLLIGAVPPGCGGPPTPPPMAEDKSQVWFEDTVLKADKVVLVEFGASWCGPCQRLKPFLHKLEQEYGDRVKVVDVDIDEHPTLQRRFRVGGIPHIMLFSNGEVLANPGAGAPPTYEDLKEMVVQWLPAEKQTVAR